MDGKTFAGIMKQFADWFRLELSDDQKDIYERKLRHVSHKPSDLPLSAQSKTQDQLIMTYRPLLPYWVSATNIGKVAWVMDGRNILMNTNKQ